MTVAVIRVCMYTLSHKKPCHFVFDFYTVCTSRNTKESLQSSLHNLPLHPNCVSTLPGKSKTTYKQHILKSIIAVRSIEFETSQRLQKVVQCSSFPILGRKLIISLIVKKFSHPTGYLIKILGLYIVAGARVAKAYFKYCQNNLVLITDVSWPGEG